MKLKETVVTKFSLFFFFFFSLEQLGKRRKQKEKYHPPLHLPKEFLYSSLLFRSNSRFWITIYHSFYKQCYYNLLLIEFHGVHSLQIIGLGVNWWEGFSPVSFFLIICCYSVSFRVQLNQESITDSWTMWCLQIFYDAKVGSCIVHLSKGMTLKKKKKE